MKEDRYCIVSKIKIKKEELIMAYNNISGSPWLKKTRIKINGINY